MRRFAAAVIIVVVAAACGGATEEPVLASNSSTPTSDGGSSDVADPQTACGLLSEVEAEQVTGADLVPNEFNDEFDCTYFAPDDPTLAATVTLRPFTASADDIAELHGVLADGTLEDLTGIGEAAVYYEEGALHSVQFVSRGTYVTVIVTGLADGDRRVAETDIAVLIAAKL